MSLGRSAKLSQSTQRLYLKFISSQTQKRFPASIDFVLKLNTLLSWKVACAAELGLAKRVSVQATSRAVIPSVSVEGGK